MSVWLCVSLVAVEDAYVTLADTGSNDLVLAAQNVLADDTGEASVEGDNDGLYGVLGTVRVISPNLAASKDILAISEDPTDCSTDTAVTNAKAIPGACIEYFITVTNNGATADATNLDIQDVLPAEVTFVSASLDTSTTNGFEEVAAGVGPTLSLPSDPDCDGTAATCEVRLTQALLAPTETGIIRIRALVK